VSVTSARIRILASAVAAWLRANRASLALGAIFSAFYSLTAGWGLPAADHPDFTHGWATDSLLPLAPLAEVNDLLLGRTYLWPLYPLFHHFVLAGFFAPYLGFEWLTGGLHAPTGTYPFGFADPVAGLQMLERIGQAVAALFGGVTVVATRHTARAFFGERAGWIAAFGVGTMLPVVYYARTGNVDGPMLSYVALGTWAFALIATRGFTLSRAVALGSCAALGAATKDMAWGCFALLPLAIIALDRRQRAARGAPLELRPYVAGAVVAVLAYVVATGIVVNPDYWLAHVAWVRAHVPFPLQPSHPATLAGYAALALDIARHVSASTNPLALALAAGGLALALVRRSPAAWLALVAIGLCLGSLVVTRMSLVRYVMPIAYVATLLGAGLLAAGLESRRSLLRWAAGAISAGVLAWQSALALDLTQQMANDSRYAAGAWLASRISPGTAIAFPVSPNYLPPLPNRDVVHVQIARDASFEAAAAALAQSRAKYVVLVPDWTAEPGSLVSRFLDPRFEAALRDGTLGYREAATFRAPGFQLHGRLDYPVVNPPVAIFERAD
jgi:hypothetical protein